MVRVITIRGDSIEMSNGQVRHLLKDQKAKIINRKPFTIQLLYELEDNLYNTDSSYDAELPIERTNHMNTKRNILVISDNERDLLINILNHRENIKVTRISPNGFFLESDSINIDDLCFVNINTLSDIHKDVIKSCNAEDLDMLLTYPEVVKALDDVNNHPGLVLYTTSDKKIDYFIDRKYINVLTGIKLYEKSNLVIKTNTTDKEKFNIVVTKDSRYPSSLFVNSDNSVKMTLEELLDTGSGTTEYVNAFIDVDSISARDYEQIKNNPKHIFFRYSTKDFIKDEEKRDPSTINAGMTLFPGQYYPAYQCLVIGTLDLYMPIIDHLILQCKHNMDNLEVIRLDVNKPIDEVAEIVNSLQTRMMKRFQIMESEQVNNFFKITEREKDPVILLVIDNLTEYLLSTQYKAVETINQCVTSIVRLGRAAGVDVLIGNDTQSISTIKFILDQIPTRVVYGKSDSDTLVSIYGKDYSNIIVNKDQFLVNQGDNIAIGNIENLLDLYFYSKAD